MFDEIFNVRLIPRVDEWSDSVGFLIEERHGDVTRIVKPGIMMEPSGEGDVLEPTFSIKTQAARMLMDRLWDQGIRPTSHKDANPQIEAIKYHLEDMRRLAYGSIKLSKKGVT